MLDEFTNIRGSSFNYKSELDLNKLNHAGRKSFVKNILILEVMTKAWCCPAKSEGVLQIPLTDLGTKSDVINMFTIPNTSYKIEVNNVINSL